MPLSQPPVVTVGSLPITEGDVTNLTADLAATTKKATLTTKGDIYAASAASTPARVGVGADGTVLTADAASASGVKWSTGAAAGVLASAEFLFTETAGAGTYTATLALSAGAKVVDVNCYSIAGPWDATTATLQVGDGTEASGYFAIDNTFYPNGALKVLNAPYGLGHSPYADLGVNYIPAGYNGEIYASALGYNVLAAVLPGVFYATNDTITMSVVTTGAGGTTGRTLIKIIYFAPVTAVAAVKS